MKRYRAVYDSKGLAFEFEDGEVTYVREDLARVGAYSTSAAIQKDIEPFVSPIDGSVINSRRDLRDHCRRHHVVPTSELVGLPPKPVAGLHPRDTCDIDETKRTLYAIMDCSRFYKEN
jgi:hypothetical protein